ncbi:DNA repair protein RAD51 homolog 2 isoform X1 [Lethenteron reissneri]|uniref:DNA repair protein RAD51 homolog 2 isoform X1 n=2 Tax=Lethenteron reissneri TaxID=7753 RepID=UPI002AB78E38|nr:DNA repair protein RAD51 homolog 2 isoform X1 [Lethenteron reissneri]XP_061415016.1 DNA repair protein RAD51 homolog 2 isoform X1 [Lethenteron reissneri]
MSWKKLRRTGVPADVCERLSKHNIHTCQDFLSLSSVELLRVTGKSYATVRQLARVVSQACAPRVITALEMRDRPMAAFFATSLAALDRDLQGGIPCGSITEVAGPSGCGKTQFCMMLSALATLPASLGGLDGGVIYIDTESAFSAERLVEIARSRHPEHFCTDEHVIAMTNRVHVYRELTTQSVLSRLESLEEELIAKRVRLLVLDSVASVLRKEIDLRFLAGVAERSELLSHQAALLKYLAEEFSLPVVLTNQITTRFKGRSGSHAVNEAGEKEMSGDGYVTAALGNTWSHCVNTRLILQYLDTRRRQILIAKSPLASFSGFVYSIQGSGLVLEDAADAPTDALEGTDPGLQPIRVRTSLDCCFDI